MKNILKMLSLASLLIFVHACSKDDDNQVIIQGHAPHLNIPEFDTKMMMGMEKMGLDYGAHAEMKTLASKIIQDQEKEIKELQEWLLVNNNK